MTTGQLMTAFPALRIAMLSIHSSPIGSLGTLDTGGMSVYVRELAQCLGAAGHQVDIYTYAPGRHRDVALYPGVRLIHLSDPGSEAISKERLPNHLQDIFDALERYRRSRNLSYHLVHSHYWLSGVVGALAQKRWNCPHLTMFHTLGVLKNRTGSDENEPGHRIAHERKLVHSADGVVVPTRKEYENLLLDYYAPSEKISVVPCGVNLEQFRPMDRAAAKAALGLEPGTPLALYVGRFAPLKGLDLLLTAMARVKAGIAGLRLLVVGGDGPRSSATLELSELSRKLGIHGATTFAGRVDHQDLTTYYNAADLLVVPSHYESFGLVVLEALACGTPVAATRFGAAETVIQPGGNGTLIANPDAASVATAMCRQLGRPAARGLSRTQIRETVTAYSWRRIAASIAEVYHRLIEHHEPRRDAHGVANAGGIFN